MTTLEIVNGPGLFDYMLFLQNEFSGHSTTNVLEFDFKVEGQTVGALIKIEMHRCCSSDPKIATFIGYIWQSPLRATGTHLQITYRFAERKGVAKFLGNQELETVEAFFHRMQ